ncbi:MAG TPA: hypothetical protein PLH19_11245 [Anaerolineae bacterium]|nr:hypothetical protein [Anaerolineae bacterium]HQH39095.1 hypothetical protein [Anaerolineae bacterium]
MDGGGEGLLVEFGHELRGEAGDLAFWSFAMDSGAEYDVYIAAQVTAVTGGGRAPVAPETDDSSETGLRRPSPPPLDAGADA